MRGGLTINRRAASRLAEQGDSRGITPKPGNVIPNPFKSKPLIEQAKVLFPMGVTREPKEVQPVAATTLAKHPTHTQGGKPLT
jgi:hypothetical protein